MSGGQDGGAVDVVLDLPGCLIADPHRAHPAIAGERVDLLLLGDGPSADPVHGLQAPVLGARNEVDDVAQVALHRPRRAESDDGALPRSEEHTSELQSLAYLVCRLLLEKKKNIIV